jgi:DNA-binding winged helix-turn-helix (wHTH) protein/pimeloyl-ACP methyl ester carboxylesterase
MPNVRRRLNNKAPPHEKSLESSEFFLKVMMSEKGKPIYRFAQFRLDVDTRLLFAEDEIVTLTPKAFDTLLALVENRGRVLSKEELMQLVWPEQFVEENNLAQNIHAIRKALGEGGGIRFIETIPKRGYRFIAETRVTENPPPEEIAGEMTASQLSSAASAAGFPQSSGGFPPTVLRAERSAATFVPKTQYVVSTGDVNIAYQVMGDGPIDIVFVMGWVSHLEYFWQEPSFKRFLTRLASFSRLILFDKRGTGLSDHVPLSDLPSLEQRMTDVQAVMDAVGSKRAALLGVSEGGPMCSLFAATYPERTLALVMIGTYAKRLWSEDYPWAPTAEQREEFLEEMKRDWGGPVGLEERAPSVADDPQFREWWATYLRMGASPGAALALTRMNAEIDVRHVLPSVRVPVLVLHRRGDRCMTVAGGRFVASLIPGTKYVELEGDDHLPFVGDQDAILDEIEEFLTGARPELQIDRVLTTVLFVLFEAVSSAFSEDERQEIQVRQQMQARHELALFRGREIDLTDARLFATFDGPARAIRCAQALAAAVARLGLAVRIGLHTGECEVIRDSVGGLTVLLGEAVARSAEIGEVLVSHTVKDLVAGSGIEFEARGSQAFRNLPGQWQLFAARPAAS